MTTRQRVSQPGIRRVAINTGGGDAPGLNAVIRAATLAALNRGWEVVGIRDGYNGLFLPEQYPDGGLINLTRARVRGITHMGGTILGTTNRGNPLHYPMVDKRGRTYEKDRSDEMMRAFRKEKIDALIAIGGDGSLSIANVFAEKGLRVIGVPKTIDNDLEHTVITFGFDTAVSFATECLDRLHSTAAVAPPGDGGGSDGTLRWLDRGGVWYLGFGGCDLDPGNSVRFEQSGCEDRAA